jgi:hypothetical protein
MELDRTGLASSEGPGEVTLREAEFGPEAPTLEVLGLSVVGLLWAV